MYFRQLTGMRKKCIIMSGGKMTNNAGQYARNALKMLEEYCEFIEEQNLDLLKENENLKSKAYKDKELAEKQTEIQNLKAELSKGVFHYVPKAIKEARDKHMAETGHSGYIYSFSPVVACDYWSCKCNDMNCDWECEEYL